MEDVDTNQINIEKVQSKIEIELWESALDELKISDEQLEEIRQIFYCVPNNKLPQSSACYDDIEIMRYHYIKIKVAEIKYRENIKNKYLYLLKI